MTIRIVQNSHTCYNSYFFFPETNLIYFSWNLLYPFAESFVPIIINSATFIGMNLEKFHKLISHKMLRRFHSKSNHIPIFKKRLSLHEAYFHRSRSLSYNCASKFPVEAAEKPSFFLLIIFSRYTSFLVTFNFHSYYFDFYRIIDSIITITAYCNQPYIFPTGESFLILYLI